jgi:aminoglycoside phosphotransferase (APT) family kinase protein
VPGESHPVAGSSTLFDRLQGLIESELGAGARVTDLKVMEDGHAGLTFGFSVSDPANRITGYVLKVAPSGVTRRGNTDVYRQAPLLRALKSRGLPVPAVPWASADDDVLGTPFIVMELLPGRVFVPWEPHASFPKEPAFTREIWLQAAQLLARLHQVDWQTTLAGWEAPQPVRDEVARWPHVLRHAQEPDWLEAGTELGRRLAASIPDEHPIGLIHGDFQPGNILYEDGRSTGVIDWELASIGAQGLDVGWLSMMSDPQAWHPGWRPVCPVAPSELVETYRNAGGQAFRNVAWYQALAHYRLGSIACLNVKLHRTGKRVDALWERFAPSIACLFARGIELVRQTND